MVWVRYFVPEDGDDLNHPNAFRVNSSGSLSLGEVKKAFPLPGTFEFRMLKQIGGRNVWWDLRNDSDAIAGNAVLLKAYRVLTASPTPAPVAASPAQRETARPVVREEGLLDLNDSSPTVAAPMSTPTPTQPVKAAAPAPLIPPASFDDDLLGIHSAPSSSSAPAKSNAFAVDPFGLNTLQPATPTASATNPMMASTSSARLSAMHKPSPVDPFASMSAPSPSLSPAPSAMNMNANAAATNPMMMRGAAMNPMSAHHHQQRSSGGGAFDPFSGLGQTQGQGQQRRF